MIKASENETNEKEINKMKKYQVECSRETAGQAEGRVPHDAISMDYIGNYIAAETKGEAIDFAIDWIADHCGTTEIDEIDVDREAQTITVFDADGEIIEQYFNFTATPRG